MVSLDWVLLGLRIITTIILYIFLGLAFYLIWRDLKQAALQRTTPPQVSGQLRVMAAVEDRSLVVGETITLQPVTLLGRDPDNTIALGDMAASNRHARISRENGVWWLEDLGSQNGTLLNELPLSKPTSLVDGDIIGIGQVRLRLEIGN